MPDVSGAFRLDSLALVEGVNTITVRTLPSTLAPRTTSLAIHVTADFTAPAVQILESGNALQDGDRFPESAVLTVSATDAGGAVVTEVTLDGTRITGTATTVTATGGHTVIAIARDPAGNETRVERTFFVGTTTTQASSCNASGFDPSSGSVLLSGTVTLVGRSDSAGVRVNGTPAFVSNGSFWSTVEVPSSGVVTVVCTDSAGVAIGDPVVLNYILATGNPSIDITSPAEGASFVTPTIAVSGTTGSSVTSVSVNGRTLAGQPQNGGFSVADARLAAGLNIVVARGIDAAGRSASSSRRVFWLETLPSITITAPVANYDTGGSTIRVSGTYGNLDPSTLAIAGVPAPTFVRQSDTSGTFEFASVQLAGGLQTITVSGRDVLNRTATATVAVTRRAGTSLSIAITSPRDNAAYGASSGTSFVVTGTAQAATGSIVEVNGAPATFDGSSFSASVNFATQETSTAVVARVTEPGGDGAFDVIRVTRFTTPFTVLTHFPAADAIEVDPGVMILTGFSAAVDRASIVGGAFRLETASGTPVSGVLHVDRDVVVFAPAALLAAGERYTIRITTAAKDITGNALASESAVSFYVASTAPQSAPQLDPLPATFCGDSITVSGTAAAGARVRIESGTLALSTTANTSGRFTIAFPLAGAPGFRLIRARVVASDGSVSPAAEARIEVDCAGPQVLIASFDRTVNKLTITFSKPVKPSSVTTGAAGTVVLERGDGTIVSGTVTLPSSSVVEVTPSVDLRTLSFALRVTTGIRDNEDRALRFAYSQFFDLDGDNAIPGEGPSFLIGEIYDATTGRPLAGATVELIENVTPLPAGEGQGVRVLVSMLSDTRGRYARRVGEGVHTIRVSVDGYTTVWRQVTVPAGAGIVPIDTRLTRTQP